MPFSEGSFSGPDAQSLRRRRLQAAWCCVTRCIFRRDELILALCIPRIHTMPWQSVLFPSEWEDGASPPTSVCPSPPPPFPPTTCSSSSLPSRCDTSTIATFHSSLSTLAAERRGEKRERTGPTESRPDTRRLGRFSQSSPLHRTRACWMRACDCGFRPGGGVPGLPSCAPGFCSLRACLCVGHKRCVRSCLCDSCCSAPIRLRRCQYGPAHQNGSARGHRCDDSRSGVAEINPVVFTNRSKDAAAGRLFPCINAVCGRQ